MLNEALLKKCLQENARIPLENLAKVTWGNYSLIDRSASLVYIKPSGVSLKEIDPYKIAVVDLSGRQISGLKRSIDTNIHLELYKSFPDISSICHTHSPYATSYAQAKKDINVYGTTHADTFAGPVRVIDPPLDIYSTGELHESLLGKFIVDSMVPSDSNAILVSHHGPFAWSSKLDAIDVAIALEEIAKMAYITEKLGTTSPIEENIKDFHWSRKHGTNKRYGQ